MNEITFQEIGQYVCTATDPRDNRPQESEPVTLNLKPREPAPLGPQVDPPEQTVMEGDPAQFRCWVPGNPHAQIEWTKEDGSRKFLPTIIFVISCLALPQGTLTRDGFLRIGSAQMSDAGRYVCTATDPNTGNSQPAPPATLHVRQGSPFQPRVDPPEQTVTVGEPAPFRCHVPGYPQATFQWSRQDGQRKFCLYYKTPQL